MSRSLFVSSALTLLGAVAALPSPASAERVPRTVFAEEFGWLT